MVEEAIEKRKQKVKTWLKNKDNLMFVGIIALAIIIRFYYFFITKDQPLWWDEADYMAYAKNLAGIENNWQISPQHNSIFPLIVSIFMRLGLSEPIIKFLLILIPSIIIVFLAYKISFLMYENKKLSLIITFLVSTFWNLMFNSMRFHVDIPAMMFALLAIYVFWQGYEKKQKLFGKLSHNWAIPLTALFLIIAYMIRRGYVLFIAFFTLYFLFTHLIFNKQRLSLLKDKYNWIGLISALTLFFVSDKFIFTESIIKTSESYIHTEIPIHLGPLQVFSIFFKNINNDTLYSPLFALLIIGSILAIITLILSIGSITKTNSSKSDLFNLLAIVVTLFYFIFIQRSLVQGGFGADPRWYYPLLFGSLIFISKGGLFLADFAKKYHKLLGVLVILLFIGYGAYEQIQHADIIIQTKVESYEGIRQAGLFIKEISNQGDKIFSVPDSQPAYYSEREVIAPWIYLNSSSNSNNTLEEFLTALKKDDSMKYVIITFSEPNHPKWMRDEEYFQDPNTGAVSYSKWKIPFMNTTIDFVSGQQDIKQSKTYGNIEFNLLKVANDAFVYEIIKH